MKEDCTRNHECSTDACGLYQKNMSVSEKNVCCSATEAYPLNNQTYCKDMEATSICWR